MIFEFSMKIDYAQIFRKIEATKLKTQKLPKMLLNKMNLPTRVKLTY